MALLIDFHYKGFTFENVYLRVDDVQGNKRKGWTAKLGTYKSKEAADTGTEPLSAFSYSVPWSATETPEKAIYTSYKNSFQGQLLKAVDA